MNEKLKCLVVEDSPTQTAALEELIARNGYEVRTAENGKEAFEILSDFTPHVIISDVSLPETDGYELCRSVKSNPGLRHISVLLLTTLSDPQEVFEALRSGADNFLTKPADEQQLVSRLQYLAMNRSDEEDDSLSAGIEINFAGQTQTITAPRLQLLNMLLSSYDIAVQKNRELEAATKALEELNEQLETKVEERTRELRQEVEQRQLLAVGMEQSASGMAIANATGRIEFVNPSMAQISNLEPTAITEIEHLSFGVEESTRETFKTFWNKVAASKAPRGDGSFVRFEEGRERVWLVRVSGFKVPGHSGEHSLISAREITEQRNLESQIRRRHRLESIGTLAGGIAHDFNNFLSAVLGYAEMALKNLDHPEQARENLGHVISAGRRAALLIQQILRFSKSDSGPKLALEAAPIIDEAVELARAGLSAKTEMHTEFDENCPRILADPTQLQQLLLNLTTNAMHAIGDKAGRIEVKAGPYHIDADDPYLIPGLVEGDYLRVSVSDTGCGIPRENMDRIFDPFFTTKGPEEGTGIGLSNCHSIVREHNGAITVYSEEGRGTTLHVYFPAATDAAHTEAVDKPDLEYAGKHEEILVVDDVEPLALLTQRRLEDYGYRVTVLTSSRETLELVEQDPQRFRLLLSDSAMPGMTGEELASKLNEIVPQLPVVILSGYAPNLVTEHTSENVKGFLAKPFSSGELQSVVRKTLDAAKAE